MLASGLMGPWLQQPACALPQHWLRATPADRPRWLHAAAAPGSDSSCLTGLTPYNPASTASAAGWCDSDCRVSTHCCLDAEVVVPVLVFSCMVLVMSPGPTLLSAGHSICMRQRKTAGGLVVDNTSTTGQPATSSSSPYLCSQDWTVAKGRPVCWQRLQSCGAAVTAGVLHANHEVNVREHLLLPQVGIVW